MATHWLLRIDTFAANDRPIETHGRRYPFRPTAYVAALSADIPYGRPEATQEEIERVTKMASADGFIAELADSEGRKGYDAFVGDRGINC